MEEVNVVLAVMVAEVVELKEVGKVVEVVVEVSLPLMIPLALMASLYLVMKAEIFLPTNTSSIQLQAI